jgi:hypothetical protein
MEGHVVTFVIKSAGDLEVIVAHHRLTSVGLLELGLEFESEQTAGVDMPLHMLLHLAEQDIRSNAHQLVAAVDGDRSLDAFLVQLAGLHTAFPWTLRLTCPMALARVEADEATVERFPIAPQDVERISAEYAEMAFDAADRADAEEEERAAAAAHES